MKDEEGYMALSPQPNNEASTHYSQTKRMQDTSKQLTQYKTLLGILGTACVILGLAGIVLIMFVLQGRCHNNCETTTSVNATGDEAESLTSLETTEDSPCYKHIALHLCEPFTEGATCKLCPTNWAEREGKCYWFSKDKKDWLAGYSDCSRKMAQMIAVHDGEEMEFINSIIQEKYPIWIGVNITSPRKTWTWVDGSSLNQTLIPLRLPETGASCGVVKGNKVRSEMCTAEFRWICEKEAISF